MIMQRMSDVGVQHKEHLPQPRLHPTHQTNAVQEAIARALHLHRRSARCLKIQIPAASFYVWLKKPLLINYHHHPVNKECQDHHHVHQHLSYQPVVQCILHDGVTWSALVLLSANQLLQCQQRRGLLRLLAMVLLLLPLLPMLAALLLFLVLLVLLPTTTTTRAVLEEAAFCCRHQAFKRKKSKLSPFGVTQCHSCWCSPMRFLSYAILLQEKRRRG